MKSNIVFALTALAAAAFAASPDAAAVRRAREQLLRFTPEAARRAMADLKNNPKYDWAKYNAAVEDLIAKLDETKNALDGDDDAAKEAAVERVEAYRQAMLANPILDFDNILCVHRKIGNPRAAFARARGSTADMIRFGSMLEDLECYVDNSVVWSETEGRIVGRHGGIRQWLRENAPDLHGRYKTVMKYKALARRFRQAVGVSDPVPASNVLPPQPIREGEDGEARREKGAGIRRGGDKVRDSREHSSEQSRARAEGVRVVEKEQEKAAEGVRGDVVEKARERAGELLGRCEGTVASLAAQLERVLSPEYAGDGDDENTVRTEIVREEGRSSA